MTLSLAAFHKPPLVKRRTKAAISSAELYLQGSVEPDCKGSRAADSAERHHFDFTRRGLLRPGILLTVSEFAVRDSFGHACHLGGWMGCGTQVGDRLYKVSEAPSEVQPSWHQRKSAFCQSGFKHKAAHAAAPERSSAETSNGWRTAKQSSFPRSSRPTASGRWPQQAREGWHRLCQQLPFATPQSRELWQTIAQPTPDTVALCQSRLSCQTFCSTASELLVIFRKVHQ